MQTSLQRLARREWRLWFCTIVVTMLASAVLVLTAFRSLYARTDHFYEITAPQARWSAFALLLLFNGWMIYRQWLFRRQKRELGGQQVAGEGQANAVEGSLQDSFRIDPTTSLCTRSSFEYLLGKEVARARRRKAPLSLVAIHIEEYAELSQRFGANAANAVAKEISDRLRKASRGVDFGVRLETDGFLLALPECGLNDGKRVLDRIGELEMDIAGQEVTLTFSIGWIDYKPGEVPSDLIHRAEQVLHLYNKASNASAFPGNKRHE
jgi:diguanylate cyclase (GGDEF)-like protein